MKTIIKWSRSAMAFSVLASVLLFTACHKSNNNTENNLPYTISGNADGSQVVPPVTDTARATLTGTYNPSNRELQYTSNWMGLSGSPTSAGFYNGAAGASGTAVGTAWTLSAGPIGTTTGKITLTDAQADELLKGNFYYTYGTELNPGGEVRGQVTAER